MFVFSAHLIKINKNNKRPPYLTLPSAAVVFVAVAFRRLCRRRRCGFSSSLPGLDDLVDAVLLGDGPGHGAQSGPGLPGCGQNLILVR
jgi:hypothetical protein